jgi:hypothetical protein
VRRKSRLIGLKLNLRRQKRLLPHARPLRKQRPPHRGRHPGTQIRNPRKRLRSKVRRLNPRRRLNLLAASGEPQSGKTYLQLSAIDHDKAEIMVELLRKKNFSAIAAEIPEKPGVFRVLVGPISEADISKTRGALQDASFPGKEAVKRTF